MRRPMRSPRRHPQPRAAAQSYNPLHSVHCDVTAALLEGKGRKGWVGVVTGGDGLRWAGPARGTSSHLLQVEWREWSWASRAITTTSAQRGNQREPAEQNSYASIRWLRLAHHTAG